MHGRTSIVGWHVRLGVEDNFAPRYEDLAAIPRRAVGAGKGRIGDDSQRRLVELKAAGEQIWPRTGPVVNDLPSDHGLGRLYSGYLVDMRDENIAPTDHAEGGARRHDGRSSDDERRRRPCTSDRWHDKGQPGGCNVQQEAQRDSRLQDAETEI
jgi:hypothetical protein